MFNKTIKYTLVSLTIWGMFGCSERTITVPRTTTTHPRATVPVAKEPSIKEEILLGQNAKNPNLGNRVDAPVNNPTLGEMIGGTYGDANATEYSDEEQNIPGEIIERMPFPAEEYKYVKKRGRSTVSGMIYLENSYNSQKVPGQKIKLWLNPVTTYSRQWYQESYLGGYRLSKTDSRIYNYLKFTYSNESGKFNFFGVPSGDYYLVGTMSCGEECGFSQSKSIRLVREISVGRGVTNVDLTKPVP